MKEVKGSSLASLIAGASIAAPTAFASLLSLSQARFSVGGLTGCPATRLIALQMLDFGTGLQLHLTTAHAFQAPSVLSPRPFRAFTVSLAAGIVRRQLRYHGPSCRAIKVRRWGKLQGAPSDLLASLSLFPQFYSTRSTLEPMDYKQEDQHLDHANSSAEKGSFEGANANGQQVAGHVHVTEEDVSCTLGSTSASTAGASSPSKIPLPPSAPSLTLPLAHRVVVSVARPIGICLRFLFGCTSYKFCE